MDQQSEISEQAEDHLQSVAENTLRPWAERVEAVVALVYQKSEGTQ